MRPQFSECHRSHVHLPTVGDRMAIICKKECLLHFSKTRSDIFMSFKSLMVAGEKDPLKSFVMKGGKGVQSVIMVCTWGHCICGSMDEK